MKKTYLLTALILFCYVQMTNAQDYIPFPTKNAMWREDFYGVEVNCSEYQYTITGDTVMEDIVYHKLQQTGIMYAAGDMGCTWYISWGINEYAGCFRNDTSAKKVYFRYSLEYPETLIYDFSLSVGDTIPSIMYDYDQYTVAAIDSIEIEGIYRKRFLIDNNCGEPYLLYIIEGIGSTYGLLPFYHCPFESNSDLICLSVEEEVIYYNPFSWEDCTPVYYNAVEDYEQKKTNITLYPNPTYSTFQIKGNDNFQNCQISIYNIFGQLVFQEQTVNEDDVIHIENLVKGIYMVYVNGNNGKTSMLKLIKL